MLFEKFQDCHYGRHLGYWNWMIQQFWISISPRYLPSSFGSTWLTVWKEIWFEKFQDGDHLGHWNRRILAILNFHITPMPPIMFKLNQTYPSVADVIWRFSKWLPWWPSWLSERNHFSNSKSPCCPDAYHQVSSPSDLLFGSRYQLKTYKIAGGDVVRFSRRLTILAILNLYVDSMPPIKFLLNQTYGLGGDVVWRISRWPPSWISEWKDFRNSESLCHCDVSHQVLAQSNLLFRRCRLKNFKMASIVAILDIGMVQL